MPVHCKHSVMQMHSQYFYLKLVKHFKLSCSFQTNRIIGMVKN